jgi:LysR family cys regulon transcriptional activator
VGIVAEMAVKDGLPEHLISRPAGQLFGSNMARVAFKRGSYLRQFVLEFAQLLSDRLNRDLVLKALEGQTTDYEL